MQDVLVVFRFKVVADFVDLVVQVGGFSKHGDEVGDQESSGDGLFVVVLNLNVDYMHRNVVG